MTAPILHRLGQRRWSREGAACPRYRCSGTLHRVDVRDSIHPGNASDPTLRETATLSIDDHIDADAALRGSATHLPPFGPLLNSHGTDWRGQGACSACSYRENIQHRDTTGGDHEAL